MSARLFFLIWRLAWEGICFQVYSSYSRINFLEVVKLKGNSWLEASHCFLVSFCCSFLMLLFYDQRKCFFVISILLCLLNKSLIYLINNKSLPIYLSSHPSILLVLFLIENPEQYKYKPHEVGKKSP